MNILEYQEQYSTFSAEQLQAALPRIKQHIELLQDIYEAYGKYSGFSKEFQSAALREREELCKKSSAVNALIREKSCDQQTTASNQR